MFEKGDHIIYETAGVCEVTDITEVDLKGMSGDKLYYILVPLKFQTSKIITPVENNKNRMRKILTSEEAHELIAEMGALEPLGIANEKLREDCYKEAIKSCDSREWIRIIKTLYGRRQDRLAMGKKLPAMDEKYLAKAKDYLYGELSVSLGIPNADVEELLVSTAAAGGEI